MTAHGFGTTAATLLDEMGQCNPDAIERQFAPMDTVAIGVPSNRADFFH
ncbi:hypothetical protein ACGGKE_11930 [Sphingobium naphthae]